MTDLDRLRLRRLGFLPPSPDLTLAGAPAFVGKVLSSGASLGVGKFFLASPTIVRGPENEGNAGTLTDQSGSIPVYLLGPGIPSMGDYLLCKRVDYRWVASRSGGVPAGPPTVTLEGCFCPVPLTLTMTSADPTCNFGMFQSCTLEYTDPDPCFGPLNVLSKQFFSTTTFLDTIANARFYYYLYCQYNQFSLTRLYCTSPYGSPFRDGTLYTWLVGGYGNNCDPFYLHNGTAFPGSDASCKVTIDPA